jgi:hypothetical protein
MINSTKSLFFIFPLLSSLSGLVFADTYPNLGIPLQLTTPKFNALASILTTVKGKGAGKVQGTVDLDLRFVYTGNNKFSCTSDSLIDGAAANCSGVQSGAKYTLAVKPKLDSGSPKTQIMLQGSSVSANTVSATYKGPKGKLTQRKISVEPQFVTAAIDSTIILKPTTGSNGVFTASSGDINSGYSQLIANIPLSGRVKTVRNSKIVSWKLTSPETGNKLSFLGKEDSNTWVGKLSGNVGPAKFSKLPITIPLVAFSPNAHFSGVVSAGDGTTSPVSADIARVNIRSDRNNNGSIESDETITADIDNLDDGHFALDFAVVAGRSVTVDFEVEGYSSTPKLFSSITPGSDIPISTTVRKLDVLSLSNADARSYDGKLQIKNIPSEIASLNGKVFNPESETAQFPGEFIDSAGNILLPSVFSAVKAQNSLGNDVTELSTETQLKMLVPQSTWETLNDLSVGNNQIDVPFYFYDETNHQWKRSANNGWLEDVTGTKLTENMLANLKDKSHLGNIYAAGNVDHLSYWSVSWPINSRSCVAGRLIDATGKPISGALITATGSTYVGVSTPVTTSYTGRFCVDVMRSEAVGEDLNKNGVMAEKSTVTLTAFAGGKFYDLGSQELPAVAPTCSALGCASGCLELGDKALDSSTQVGAEVCNIEGKILYSGIGFNGSANLSKGDPVPDLVIAANDPSAPDEVFNECFEDLFHCQVATSDSTGEFSMKVAVSLGAEFWVASSNLNANFYLGSVMTKGCPTDPVIIYADYYKVSN